MRIKRLHVGLFVGAVFLVWNFITYSTLVNHPSPDLKDGRSVALSNRLDQLQKEVGKQMEDNRRLLESLKLAKAAPKANEATAKPGNGEVPVAVVSKGVHSMAASPEQHLPHGVKDGILPILMIACDRITVSRSLDKLLEYRKDAKKFPIIVSQDCGHKQTAEVIQKYVKSHNITHIRQPDLSNINLPWPQKKFVGYYKISRHYKWALDQIFVTFNFSTVIIVEDDLDISPDFYEYFAATYPILHNDPKLWCVSAWNDNGKDGMVSNDPELLYRTDFFPGLGWMIERSLWMDLRNHWPDTFWDDWMRHPEQRKGRECIRPEICRTSTFGKKGVSKGLFYDKHLKFIKLNTVAVPFTTMDISYLYKGSYDSMYKQEVYGAPLMSANDVKNGAKAEVTMVRVEYTNKDSFKKLAKLLGIMDDFKAGVPRAAYMGVVSFMLKGRRVYLAPPSTWKGYDTSWS